MKNVTTDLFHKIISESENVVVDFWATWCGPCRMLAPVMEEVAEEIGDKVTFVKVDIDNEESLAREYGIMAIPTIIAIKNGKEVAKNVGFMPYDELEEFVKKNLDIE